MDESHKSARLNKLQNRTTPTTHPTRMLTVMGLCVRACNDLMG